VQVRLANIAVWHAGTTNGSGVNVGGERQHGSGTVQGVLRPPGQHELGLRRNRARADGLG